MLTLTLLGLILVLALFWSALWLWGAGKLVSRQPVSYWRSLAAAGILACVGLAGLGLLYWLKGAFERNALNPVLLPVAEGVLMFGISMAVLGRMLRTSIGGAFLAFVANILAGASALALLMFVVRPFLLEAFIVPTSAMAPTIVGWHRSAPCPHCQGSVVLPSYPPDDPMVQRFREDEWREIDVPGICERCLKISKHNDVPKDILAPDRILVNKWYTPRRWDIIVFRYPREPGQKFVKRLVGLPGETIVIKEGAVWANGEKLAPPESLANLRYLNGHEINRHEALATDETPTQLKDDEFFVLGDFTTNSADSREFGPVPVGNVEGVVVVRYLPLNRFQVWR